MCYAGSIRIREVLGVDSYHISRRIIAEQDVGLLGRTLVVGPRRSNIDASKPRVHGVCTPYLAAWLPITENGPAGSWPVLGNAAQALNPGAVSAVKPPTDRSECSAQQILQLLRIAASSVSFSISSKAKLVDGLTAYDR
jgi:hypothetical protein